MNFTSTNNSGSPLVGPKLQFSFFIFLISFTKSVVIRTYVTQFKWGQWFGDFCNAFGISFFTGSGGNMGLSWLRLGVKLGLVGGILRPSLGPSWLQVGLRRYQMWILGYVVAHAKGVQYRIDFWVDFKPFFFFGTHTALKIVLPC